VVLLGSNVKDLVGIGQAQTSTNRDEATINDSAEYCKIKITAIVNANLITEELRNDQDFGKGNDVFWPKKLVGRPVQVAAVSQPLPTDLNQTPTSQPQIPPAEDLKSEDHVMNYALQVMQMGIFFMQLDDTEHEGDGERMMRNWKLLMLYARCSGRSKKYAFEALRLITYCRALYTEKMAHRVIHGQCVNPLGGMGRNYANDLKQEHLVKCNKVILQGLCGNKTLKAVTRATQSAYNVKKITENFDHQSNITPESQSNTYGDPSTDIKQMANVLRKLKPFSYTKGRKHAAFPTIPNSPLNNVDVSSLDAWLTTKKKAIAKNPFLHNEAEDGEESEEEDEITTLEDLSEEEDM
jgi:hypothetical protein